jgi:hypothetical protein
MNGFVRWGGDWTGPVDYQHFEVPKPFIFRLVRLSPAAAKVEFEGRLTKYAACRKNQKTEGRQARKACLDQVYFERVSGSDHEIENNLRGHFDSRHVIRRTL